MLINMVLPGAAGSAEEPFAFEYSGNFTDNRVDGVGTVRLNTSGTLTVTGAPVTVSATIVGAGGGAAINTTYYGGGASGGGGGIQTVEVTLEPGAYDIVIGTGGSPASKTGSGTTVAATNGGDTTAFGYTSTGGKGASGGATPAGGAAGAPNATAGTKQSYSGQTIAGGSPNGGGLDGNTPQAGGDGYVDLTFS